ncbi:hypothetical protein N9D63_01445 [Opitutales bacterium]|jgi:arylsulfatase A-like enzyme|nr:hypothetical protein [Opitutales bacterium]
MATLVDLAGTKYPEVYGEKKIKTAPGKSLLPTFKKPKEVKEPTLFWEHEAHVAIRQGNWSAKTLPM